MDETLKNNEYILSHEEEFQTVYSRAKEKFSKFKDVIGVAFGQKKTNNKYREDISIIVIVAEKKRLEDISPDERIPVSFEGYLVDVTIPDTLQLGVCNDSSEHEKIKGGIQICSALDSARRYEAATLGCIVRKKHDNDRENVHLLSNWHVLYSHGRLLGGHYIYQPWLPTPSGFPNIGPSNALGKVNAGAFFGNYPFTPRGSTSRDFFIDCATSRINIDCKCWGTTCTKDVIEYDTSILGLNVGGSSTIIDVRSIIGSTSIIGKAVFKVGRTTGKTKGIVRSVTWVEPWIGGTEIKEVIKIDFDTSSSSVNCNGHAHFGEKGDSGALVVDEQRRAVGLLFGVPPDGTTAAHPSFACHILPVLEKMGYCIPTDGGTSRCSCGATDGTGLIASNELNTDGIFFARHQIETPEKDSGLFQPEPLTDGQQEHLSELFEVLRSTAKGRELHEAFRHVRREIGYLVRKCRPVTVAWHSNKGPAFFAAFLNHLKGDLDELPTQINGVDLAVLLDKMESILPKHGSIPLKETIETHGGLIKAMLLEGNSVDDFIEHLKTTEMT